MHRPTNILNAASNLLGICLAIIAGLNVSHFARTSIADEIAWGAAVALAASCILSYLALRTSRPVARLEAWADRVFLIGLLALFSAIVTLAVDSA